MPNTQLPPLRDAWVTRNALLDRLDRVDAPLILVTAPAGSGKSTLLTQFVHRASERHVGWVALEAADNDPEVFWRRVFTALRVAPGFDDEHWVRLSRSVAGPDRSVLADLVNSLMRIPERVLLVLDDYSCIDNPQVDSSLHLFLSHLPRTVQVMVASRTEPQLAVGAMRANRLLTEITGFDLAFSEDETAEALRRSRPAITDEAVARVQKRTEGWATGVYLATHSGSYDEHTAATRHGDTVVGFEDYLTTEMLAEFTPDEREFLRETSVLERLSGDLCDHVAERSGSAELLSSMTSANLLIVPLDPAGEWFRYHNLLREFLRSELQEVEPERVARLHMLAHEWFLKDGAISEAIGHALDAGELMAAANLVCTYYFAYAGGRMGTPSRWLGWFPEDLITGYPPLTLAAAYVNAYIGDVVRSRNLIAIASEANYQGPTFDGSSSFESSVAVFRAGLYPAGVADAAENGEKAYRLESPGSPWRPLAAAVVGVARMASGDFAGATEALTEAAPNLGVAGTNAYALGQLALLSAWAGDWDEAEDHSRHAIELLEPVVEPTDDPAISGPARLAAAAVAQHRGDAGSAAKQLRLVEAVLPSHFPHIELELRVLAAEIYVAMGDFGRAAQHAQAGAGALEMLGDGGIWAGRLAEVRQAIAQTGPTSLPAPEPEQLTLRERQVLTLLDSDLTLRDIGFELFISRNTAKTHVAKIYNKLGVSGRDEAVARARDYGLL